MLKAILLAPGRLAARLVLGDERKSYRSRRRSGPTSGPGAIVISGIFWLVFLLGVVALADRAGFLKQALDVGSEMANQQNEAVVDASVAGGNVSGGVAPGVSGSGVNTSLSSPLPPSGQATGNATPPPSQAVAGSTPGAATTVEAAGNTEGWLVIMHTIPKSGREEAERRKKQYKNKGVLVEIYDTDAFPRLKGGFWIVSQGPFKDRDSALRAAEVLKSVEPGLIVRRGL